MNEKPKSVWEKSLKLPWIFSVWLGLMMATMLIFAIIIWLNNDVFNKPSDFIGLLIFSAIVATILLCLWLFIRWLFCWRNFKRFLFGLACFATLIALFYAEEDWRGKHAWEKFKHEQEAKGERFDWQSIVPPPVPDEQNFAMSPVWIAEEKYTFLNQPKRAEAWYGDRIYSDEVSRIVSQLPVSESGLVGTNWWVNSHKHLPEIPDLPSSWTTAHFADLKPWQSYYRDLQKTNPAAAVPITPQPQTPAQDVLLALSKFDPVIEKLRTDSSLPDSRFPVSYNDGLPWEILLPHLAAEKRYAYVLQLRSLAELENGQSEKAFEDVKLMLRLADASRTEPFLISHLVRIAILNLALQSIWEGLAEHKWSDEQLAQFNQALAKLDFLADYEFSMRGQRTLNLAGVDYLRHSRNYVEVWNDYDATKNQTFSAEFYPRLFQMLPSGFFYQNELTVARLHQQWSLPIVDTENRMVSPGRVHQNQMAIDKAVQRISFYNFFAHLFVPAMEGPARKMVWAQTSTDLARVAIALERYRLAQGEFPESLDALAPQFIKEIPHDIINGQSLKYRRDANGQFVLYSVGWNETDDGGVVVLKKGSSPRDESRTDVDINQGDWVWRYPQK